MVISLHAPSSARCLGHAPTQAAAAPIARGQGREGVRAMVIFVIATLAMWLSARITVS
jgi:hypothetical protein